MSKIKYIILSALLLTSFLEYATYAQNYSTLLSMEGLDHTSSTSITSIGMGGVAIGLKRDVSLMFTNPAILGTVDALTVSAGTSLVSTTYSQTQQWYPLFAFGALSTLMDGSTRGIVPRGTATSPADTNWVPFDNLGPNWDHNRSAKVLPNIFAAMPFMLNKVKVTVGMGYAEYANMDYFYQNNNDLSPEYDLVVVGNPADVTDSVARVDWFQNVHKREGSLQCIGGAVAVDLNDVFTFGISGRLITGSTNDYDSQIGRGVIWFYSGGKAQKIWGATANTCIRVDSAVYTKVLSGTSDFSGFDFTLSSQYHGKFVTVGAAVTLPTTITRDFKGTTTADTSKRKLFPESHNQASTIFTQKMNLPIKAKLGIGMQLRSNVYMAAELDYLPYEQAELESNGMKTNPWRGGTAYHVGLNWNPIDEVALRFGYRQQKEVFTAQYAAPNEPVSYNAYSIGAGLNLFTNLSINLAYEFYQVKYEDAYTASYNINKKDVGALCAEVSYIIK